MMSRDKSKSRNTETDEKKKAILYHYHTVIKKHLEKNEMLTFSQLYEETCVPFFITPSSTGRMIREMLGAKCKINDCVSSDFKEYVDLASEARLAITKIKKMIRSEVINDIKDHIDHISLLSDEKAD